MSLELQGRLVQVLGEETGTGRNGVWRKQSFVIETGDQYPKKVCFVLWGDKIEILQSLASGDELKVYFDVESREYNSKWYTDVKAWKLEKLSGGTANEDGDSYKEAPQEPFFESSDEPDLPF
ncbi:MAG TPA: hypothetical protein DCM08_06580 [Microscillaceae bacterium]|jgi:hypothetical protein|nr:hypothetical protein [Microscillaceae bacterium]